MRTSPAAYIFAADMQPGQHPCPLHILRLNNKGKPRNADQMVTLRRQPLASTETLENIAANKNSFANSDECLENNRFVLHFSQYDFIL